MSDNPLRVLIANDPTVTGRGLAELLSRVADFQIIGQADSSDTAIKLTREFQPDTVVLDTNTPGAEATETVRHLQQACPRSGIVVVACSDDPDLIRELINAGARTFLLNEVGRRELVAAVYAAAEPGGLVRVAGTMQAFTTLTKPTPTSAQLLSDRELEVLNGLLQAKTNRSIGNDLNITEKTVKRHLSNIYTKLNVGSRAEAIRAAQQRGIIVD
jgi:DNA-binding NarL/FixJ family response regulator